MNTTTNLPRAIRNIAWGYLLIHLNFSFGSLNILPDWGGYLLFFSALPILCNEDESASLLRPLCIFLTIWEIFLWVNALLGLELNTNIVHTVIDIISIYFHFQFLTNIASIAQHYNCSQSKTLLTLRTIQTISATIFSIPLPFEQYEAVFLVLLIFLLIVCFCLVVVLFSLKNSLETRKG